MMLDISEKRLLYYLINEESNGCSTFSFNLKNEYLRYMERFELVS